jgi:broad specificity phosphatase PhoE
MAAEYLRAMNPTLLLSSGYTRAMETARIIGSVLDLSPRQNDLFRELDRPTSLSGKHLFHPATFVYVFASVLFRNNPARRYEDAENFNDLYTRIKAALAYIEALKEDHNSIVIVSHTEFMNLLVAYMCHDRMIAVRDLLPSFFNIGTTAHCGVVELRYVGDRFPKPRTCAWELIARNGTAST